jgi:hypothetical protein
MNLKKIQGGLLMRIIIETDTAPTIQTQTVAPGAQSIPAVGEIQTIDAGAAPLASGPVGEEAQGREDPMVSDSASSIDAGAPAIDFIESMQGIEPPDKYRLWESLNPELDPDV